MNEKLKEKLRIRAASLYAKSLCGADFIGVRPLSGDFSWHISALEETYKFSDNRIAAWKVFNLADKAGLIKEILELLARRGDQKCTLLHEEGVALEFMMTDMKMFLTSLCAGVVCFNICFGSPDEIVVASEEEYEIELYHFVKGTAD